jgi:hypothetical protein
MTREEPLHGARDPDIRSRQDDQAIAHGFELTDDVRREEHRRTPFGHRRKQHLEELSSGEWVEIRYGFVEEEQVRRLPHAQRQSNQCLLAEREPVHPFRKRDIGLA